MSVEADLEKIRGELTGTLERIHRVGAVEADQVETELENLTQGLLATTGVILRMRQAVTEAIDVEAIADAHERAMDSAARDIRDAITDGFERLGEMLVKERS